jgi:hypothetical protein
MNFGYFRHEWLFVHGVPLLRVIGKWDQTTTQREHRSRGRFLHTFKFGVEFEFLEGR